jgi:hypothetical protein
MQMTQLRQSCMDSAGHELQKLQSRLDRAADQERCLQQQLEEARAAAEVRGEELRGAAGQLAAALEREQQAEASHKRVLSSRDARIRYLQERLAALAAAGQEAAGAHEGQLAQLVESLGQLKETCTKQVGAAAAAAARWLGRASDDYWTAY